MSEEQIKEVIPARVIKCCLDCSQVYLCDFSDVGLKKVPQDCPLEDYKGWQSQPGSEGWWWHCYPKTHKLYKVYKPMIFWVCSDGTIKLSPWLSSTEEHKPIAGGKWRKVILPEEEQ